MEELLGRLEAKIKALLDEHDDLKLNNKQMRQTESTLAREKDALLIKQHKAINQIEVLISRLKAIEKIA